jgi:hypothetical protein
LHSNNSKRPSAPTVHTWTRQREGVSPVAFHTTHQAPQSVLVWLPMFPVCFWNGYIRRWQNCKSDDAVLSRIISTRWKKRGWSEHGSIVLYESEKFPSFTPLSVDRSIDRIFDVRYHEEQQRLGLDHILAHEPLDKGTTLRLMDLYDLLIYPSCSISQGDSQLYWSQGINRRVLSWLWMIPISHRLTMIVDPPIFVVPGHYSKSPSLETLNFGSSSSRTIFSSHLPMHAFVSKVYDFDTHNTLVA